LSRPACFLDRDGTLTEDRGYARGPEEIALLPGAAAAVRQLNGGGVAVVLISNQSGVGRGYFSMADLELQHDRLQALLMREGARLDAIYVCPHRPDEGCACRKPATGLLVQAAAELDLALTRSWLIGDREEDVATGERGAAGGVLVRTGLGEETFRRLGPARFPEGRVFPDLLAAVTYLLAAEWRVGEGGRRAQ
jgi:histidinol-phosphate phosphatase family protein